MTRISVPKATVLMRRILKTSLQQPHQSNSSRRNDSRRSGPRGSSTLCLTTPRGTLCSRTLTTRGILCRTRTSSPTITHSSTLTIRRIRAATKAPADSNQMPIFWPVLTTPQSRGRTWTNFSVYDPCCCNLSFLTSAVVLTCKPFNFSLFVHISSFSQLLA